MTSGKLRVKRDTIARTVVLFVALANQIFVIFGGDALPFDDTQVFEAVSTLLTAGAATVAWWKNNSFTERAILSDLKLAMHKRDKASQRERGRHD